MRFIQRRGQRLRGEQAAAQFREKIEPWVCKPCYCHRVPDMLQTQVSSLHPSGDGVGGTECPSWVSVEVCLNPSPSQSELGLFPGCWLSAGKSLLLFCVNYKINSQIYRLCCQLKAVYGGDLHCIHLCLFMFSLKILIVCVLSTLWPGMCLLFLSHSCPQAFHVPSLQPECVGIGLQAGGMMARRASDQICPLCE